MEKKIIEKSDILIKYDNGDVEVVCSACGRKEEVLGGSKQRNLLENWPEKAKSWECLKCWKEKQDRENAEGYHIGQAINLAHEALIRNGVEVTPEKMKAKVKFYYNLIKEIQNEYGN